MIDNYIFSYSNYLHSLHITTLVKVVSI